MTESVLFYSAIIAATSAIFHLTILPILFPTAYPYLLAYLAS